MGVVLSDPAQASVHEALDEHNVSHINNDSEVCSIADQLVHP